MYHMGYEIEIRDNGYYVDDHKCANKAEAKAYIRGLVAEEKRAERGAGRAGMSRKFDVNSDH